MDEPDKRVMGERGSSRVWSVYRYYDAQGQLLYVGMTGQGYLRAHNHGRGESPWWPLVVRGEFEHFASMDEAFQRELELIRTLTPLHNRADNPAWQPPALRRTTEHKRDQVERYLASLTLEQRVVATGDSVAAALSTAGVQVTGRYVRQIMEASE